MNSGSVLNVLATLALVAAAAVAYLWLMRFAQRAKGGGRGNPLELVGRLSFGAASGVVVVRFRDRDYVLGVTRDGIQLIEAREAGDR